MAKRIVFTGGSGKAGKHVVPWLKAKGHEILNVDLKPLDCPGVNTLITDVTELRPGLQRPLHALRLRRL